MIAVFTIYALLPAIALSALPVHQVGNHYVTLLASVTSTAATRATQCSALSGR